MRGILLWLLPVMLLGCGQDAPPPDLPPRAIQWLHVSSSITGEQRVISGIVTAVSDARLAFEVGGTVQSVRVALGDRVARGQVLAELDPEPFELVVRDAEATLAFGLAFAAVLTLGLAPVLYATLMGIPSPRPQRSDSR